MKKILLLLSIILLTSSAFAQNQQERLKKHVYTLTDDSFQGRRAGTMGAYMAAEYIAGQFSQMGLKPYNETYISPFVPTFGQDSCNNVIGIVEGSDPVLKDEYIVIGGHFDHLGVKGGEVYNGADDNASGTAAVIEIARALLAKQGLLKRSVILVCFDGEEQGLWGSTILASQFNNVSNVKLMMSLDMVGWLKQGHTLRFAGCGMLKGCEKTLEQVADQMQMPISTKKLDNFIFGGTDSDPFAQKKVPALHVTTGLKSPYHKPGDDADLIDYEGLDRITSYLTEAIVVFANAPQLETTGRQAMKHRTEMRPFEAGLQIGYGSSQLSFYDGAFTGESRLGWHGGAVMRVNMKSFALQLEAYYDQARNRYPDANDPYNHSMAMKQQSITVPLSLQLQTRQPMYGLNIGVGPYYSRTISYSASLTDEYDWDLNPNQWGWQWTLGVRLGRLLIQGQSLIQLNDVFTSSTATIPEIGFHRYNVSLIYLF